MAATPSGSASNAASASVHHEIARDIGQQVETLILNAKRASETKVGQEIQKIKTKMESMNEKMKLVTERVNQLDPASGVILKTDLQKSIAKLEDVWEGEVGTLKHELWQTIQAHNHNADLMKHHKDAIDQIQGRMAESAPNPELESIHGQLLAVDKVMQREQAKQQQIDQFMQRLSVVQQQLTAACLSNGTPWGGGGYGGLAGYHPAVPSGAVGAAAAMAAAVQPTSASAQAQAAAMAAVQAQAVAAAATKKAQRKAVKQAKGVTAKAPGAGGAMLRAEAAEFVPGG